MRGWKRAQCRNAHILHCLLKIILSADLLPFLKLGSITNSHTNNPNSERGKSWSKTMEKQKKQKKTTRGFCNCVSPTISVAHVFCVFLFSCFLGSEKLSPWQTSIGTAFTPPQFILMSLLSYWFWLLSHERQCTVKTALSPTSSGTPLDWCFTGMPRFWFLIFKGLARVLQTWNH